MSAPALDVVTGAFGFVGRAIAGRLLAQGREVRTLTRRRQEESPFGGRVEAFPLDFRDPAALAVALRGGATLYNTYWVRFPRGGTTFEGAVRNTQALLHAAEAAGVRRVVHISISGASDQSPLPYFRGKGVIEGLVSRSGLSHAILRPTVIFGPGDLLINNIAWLLRRSPILPIPGRGDYRLQPVFVEDVAELAVQAGQREDDTLLDAVGPETYTYEELVRLIAETVGSRARIVHTPPELALLLARLIGLAVRDVLLTRDELRGLMAGLLVSHDPPTGTTPLSQWLAENGAALGRTYASEVQRHYRQRVR